MQTNRLAATLAIVLALGAAPPAPAQVPDHLKCQKVKDSLGRGTFTADLGGFVPDPGCTVKLPPVLFCEGATKTNVNPPPPGTGGAGPVGGFLCYKTRCAKRDARPLVLDDQFGSHELQVSSTRLLCAPVVRPTCDDADLLAPCGTCGNGLCVPVFPQLTSQCVDLPTCIARDCATPGSTPCDPDRVCMFAGDAIGCCRPCF